MLFSSSARDHFAITGRLILTYLGVSVLRGLWDSMHGRRAPRPYRVGWRLPSSLADTELPEETLGARRAVLFLLRYVCPLGIVAVLVAAYS